jgi:hypothetical protein
MHVVDTRLDKMFTVAKLEERPLKVFYQHLENRPPLIILVKACDVEFHQILIPWRLWTRVVAFPIEMRRCVMQGKAARIGVLFSDGSMQFLSPRNAQVATICHSRTLSFPTSVLVDRGIPDTYTRDHLFVCADDGYIETYNCNTSPCVPISRQDVKGTCLALCQWTDQWVIAVGTRLGEVLFFDYKNSKMLKKLPITAAKVEGVLVHEKSRSLFVIIQGRIIRMSLRDGAVMSDIPLQVEKVRGICGDLLVFGFANGALYMAKIHEKTIEVIQNGTDQQHSGGVTALGTGSSFFLTAGAEGSVLVWNFNSEIVGRINVPLKITSCCLLNGQRQILVGTEKAIMIVDGSTIFGDEVDEDDGQFDTFDERKDELLWPVPAAILAAQEEVGKWEHLRAEMAAAIEEKKVESSESDTRTARKEGKLQVAAVEIHTPTPAPTSIPTPIPTPAPVAVVVPNPREIELQQRSRMKLMEEMLGIKAPRQPPPVVVEEKSELEPEPGEEEDMEAEEEPTAPVAEPTPTESVQQIAEPPDAPPISRGWPIEEKIVAQNPPASKAEPPAVQIADEIAPPRVHEPESKPSPRGKRKTPPALAIPPKAIEPAEAAIEPTSSSTTGSSEKTARKRPRRVVNPVGRRPIVVNDEEGRGAECHRTHKRRPSSEGEDDSPASSGRAATHAPAHPPSARGAPASTTPGSHPTAASQHSRGVGESSIPLPSAESPRGHAKPSRLPQETGMTDRRVRHRARSRSPSSFAPPLPAARRRPRSASAAPPRRARVPWFERLFADSVRHLHRSFSSHELLIPLPHSSSRAPYQRPATPPWYRRLVERSARAFPTRRRDALVHPPSLAGDACFPSLVARHFNIQVHKGHQFLLGIRGSGVGSVSVAPVRMDEPPRVPVLAIPSQSVSLAPMDGEASTALVRKFVNFPGEAFVGARASLDRRKKGMLATPRIVNPLSGRKDGLKVGRVMMWRARQAERKRFGK